MIRLNVHNFFVCLIEMLFFSENYLTNNKQNNFNVKICHSELDYACNLISETFKICSFQAK